MGLGVAVGGGVAEGVDVAGGDAVAIAVGDDEGDGVGEWVAVAEGLGVTVGVWLAGTARSSGAEGDAGAACGVAVGWDTMMAVGAEAAGGRQDRALPAMSSEISTQSLTCFFPFTVCDVALPFPIPTRGQGS